MASKYAGIIQDELRDLRGNAMVGAVVIVREVGTTTPATVYNNPVEIASAGGGDALVNDAETGIPTASGLLQPGIDANGNYTFYADAELSYDLRVVWQGLTFDYRVRPKVVDEAYTSTADLTAALTGTYPEVADLHTNMVPATVASPSATRLALQALLDGGGVIDGGKRTYIIDEELEIKVDGTTLHLEGATIQGPVAGTALGGLLCVSDRADPTRVVKNVSVLGGKFVPKNAGDNGLCAVAAVDLIIDGSTVDLTTGLRGFAIQTDSTFTGNGGKPLQRIRLSNIATYGGGTNGFNIESDGLADSIDQVTVRGVKISGAVSPVRISAGSSSYKLTGIVVDGVEADGASGTGILWYHAKQSKLSNVLLRAVTGSGIDAANTDDNQWSNITILGPAATGNAIAYTDGTHASLNDVDIQGTFAIALYNGMVADLTATNVRIKTATIGLYTTGNAQRSVYDGFTFEDVATKLNAFRAGDIYRNFAERSGSTVTPYVPA